MVAFHDPHVWDDLSLTKGRIKLKKTKDIWSSIFSWATKITKEVLVCDAPFRRKIGTKHRGVILSSPVIEVVR